MRGLLDLLQEALGFGQECAAGHEDEARRELRAFALHVLEELHAGLLRHQQIAQGHVEVLARREQIARLARAADADDVVLFAQRGRERLGHRALVVDRRARGRWHVRAGAAPRAARSLTSRWIGRVTVAVVPTPERAGQMDLAAEPAHDAEADREPEPRADAGGLGREERIERVPQHFGRHPDAVVAHGDDHGA